MRALVAVWLQAGVLLVIPKRFRTRVVLDTARVIAHEWTRVVRVRNHVCCKPRSQVEGLGAAINLAHKSE
jgi:hypothetical protein